MLISGKNLWVSFGQPALLCVSSFAIVWCFVEGENNVLGSVISYVTFFVYAFIYLFIFLWVF